MNIWQKSSFLVLMTLALAACGGGGGGGSAPPPAPQTFTVGGTVGGLTGTVVLQNNGGNNLSVSANGSFTFSTAINSGTAYAVTVQNQPAGQTCTVSSGSGTATANITNVAVACTTNPVVTFTIGGTVSGLTGTVVLQNNGGNNLSLNANGPFTFSTAINSGAAYAVAVLTGPSGQTCTVSNGNGTATANVTNVAVTCSTISAANGKFLYVSNTGDSTISSYTINATTGVLTAVPGSPIASGGSAPTRLSIHPSAPFLYVVNGANTNVATSNNVAVFAINTTTGALSAIAGSPYATGRFSTSLAFDSTGTFLYVSNAGTSDISAFRVDATTGALTSVAGSPFAVTATNASPFSLQVAGGFVYLASLASNTLHVFAIDASTGALTARSSVASGTPPSGAPNSIILNPAGTVAYAGNSGIANGGNQLITAYTIDSTSGALAAQPATTVSVQAGTLSMDPQGRFLIVPDRGTGGISVFPINATTAALGPAVTGSPFTAGSVPVHVRVNPQGTFAYAANRDSANISVLPFNSTTGALGAGSNVASGTSPNTIAIY